MIYYGFIKESFIYNRIGDDLLAQVEYAKFIGRYILIDINNELFLNADNFKVDITNKEILLRTDYEHINQAISLVKKHNGLLIEDEIDRIKISNWPDYINTERLLIKCSGFSLFSMLNNYFKFSHNKDIFIKSCIKEFSSVMSYKEIENLNICGEKNYIFSQTVKICEDCLGKKEVRFFIFNQKIFNSSRYVTDISHSIENGFLDHAKKIVDHLSENVDFPKNYVLDVMECFINNEHKFDVVEINPISTSLCYLNNSVFNENIYISDQNSFGSEFCYTIEVHKTF